MSNVNHSKVDYSDTNHGNLKHSTSGAIKQYVLGFILSIIFTAIPFLMVISGLLSVGITVIIILVAAVIQFFIQMVFFMHVTEGPDKKWNLASILFTSVMVFIVVAGSVWIMFSLDHFAGHAVDKLEGSDKSSHSSNH